MWGGEAGALGPAGFVWVEGKEVIGNISIRRAAYSGGWIIGNVAVRADRRGEGIGRALMETALESAARRGGTWVGLEVQEENQAARRLYEGLGFRPVGTMLELVRPASPWPDLSPPRLTLRPAQATEARLLYRMALSGLDRLHREVLEIRPSAYRTGWEARLGSRLEGRREGWWVAVEGKKPVGAVGLFSYRAGRWHRLELLAYPHRLNDVGPRLAEAGCFYLSRRAPWEAAVSLPGLRERLAPALSGFRRLRRLIQMRLPLDS